MRFVSLLRVGSDPEGRLIINVQIVKYPIPFRGSFIIMETFPIAPMSRGIAILSAILLAIPAGLLIAVLSGVYALMGLFVPIVFIYGWVWLLFRPTTFIIHPDTLEIVWPLKRRHIERASITNVRKIDVMELKQDTGWSIRVGAGGLWGGFGWLWTQRRGIV